MKRKVILLITIIAALFIAILVITHLRGSDDQEKSGELILEEESTSVETDTIKLDELTEKIADEYSSEINDIKSNTSIDSDGNTTYYSDFMDSDIEDIDLDDIIDFSIDNEKLLETNMPESILKNMIIYSISVFRGTDTVYICDEDDIIGVKEPFIYKCHLHNDSDSFEVLVDISNIKLKLITSDNESNNWVFFRKDKLQMKKLSNSNILIIIAATVISITLCIVITKPFNKKNTKPEVQNINTAGNIENVTESNDEEYIPDIYDEIDTSGIYVYITNMEYLDNVLTMQAIQNLYDECSTFLNKNGYSESHELTVDKNSIINDEGLPYFECSVKDINDKTLCITYNRETQKFNIKFKQK